MTFLGKPTHPAAAPLLLPFMQIMILFYEGDSRITDLPEMLQPLVKKVLLPIARLLGFKSHYPSHRSAAGGSTAADEGARNPKEEASEEEEKDEL